ncbi:MAG TPA: helix-turn-helix domain-containing protein [Thermoanaerobaculia bacterium]|jgi:AcrR family transcriptional regulator|nr:helix-turn-helix domain-containing protein [Thermoanaerobaculia bacterium]
MKQRARALEDKAERSAAILKAARELWSSSRDFSMTDVAARAGIVKGTIYLYFKTREELIEAVVEQLIEECFDDIDRQLRKRRGRWSAEQVAGVFERALRGRVPIADALKLARPRLEKTAALLESRYRPLGEVIALLGGKRAARSSRRRRRA